MPIDDSAGADRRKPLVFGSAQDLQLTQALNHFKGLPVALAKPAGPKQ